MNTTKTPGENLILAAYVAPFAAFMGGMVLVSLVQMFAPMEGGGPLWLKEPKYWVYPLQTVVCAALLVWFWRNYEWGARRRTLAGVVAGLVVLGIWVAPQWLLGTAPRTDGFNPDVFASSPALWWSSLALRFVRLVVVVPLLEEIFWRGFLLRYLIKEDFTKVPFGAFSVVSFSVVTVMFGLAHWGADFIPAILTGVIYNYVAVKTKSLTACVVAHAVTNLGLGIYIMQTKQWGFW
jgi:CAAX prenyl protease-like protein